MRDLIFFVFVAGLLFLSLRNVFAAYLAWGWSGLFALNTFAYGFIRDAGIVQLFALIALVLLLRGKNMDIAKFKPERTSWLFMLLAVHALACAALAYPGLNRNWELATNLVKTLLFCIFMPMLATSRFRIHALVVAMALGVDVHAMIEGLKYLASGGGHNVQGSGNFGDNNHFAVAVVMGMPLLYYLFQYSRNKLVRLAAAGALLVTALSVIGTNSRGGLVCMVIMAIWIIMKSRRRLMGMVFAGAAAAIIIQLAPASWYERMDTISTAAESDLSFLGRVIAWKRSSAIALENPVFGGGFHAVQTFTVFEKFRDKPGVLGFIDTPPATYPAAAHSIYFETMGDMGFVGFTLFVACLLNAFMVRMEIMALIRLDPARLAGQRI